MNMADAQLTTATTWWVTLVVATVDILLILMIGRFIPTGWFHRLPRWIVLFSFLFFTAVWSSVLTWGWDWFYSYIFPAWVRNTGLAWGTIYGAMGLGMWWLSVWLCRRLPGHPAVNFCLLGGLEGFLTHLWAIYGLGAASKPPIMHGVDPFSVLIFAVFEKAFYWTLILLLSAGALRLTEFVRHQAQPA